MMFTISQLVILCDEMGTDSFIFYTATLKLEKDADSGTEHRQIRDTSFFGRGSFATGKILASKILQYWVSALFDGKVTITRKSFIIIPVTAY